jgi:hypothetical protein
MATREARRLARGEAREALLPEQRRLDAERATGRARAKEARDARDDVAHTQLTAKVEEMGLRSEECGAGGNCLFFCVAKGTGKVHKEAHKKLRTITCDEMQKARTCWLAPLGSVPSVH